MGNVLSFLNKQKACEETLSMITCSWSIITGCILHWSSLLYYVTFCPESSAAWAFTLIWVHMKHWLHRVYKQQKTHVYSEKDQTSETKPDLLLLIVCTLTIDMRRSCKMFICKLVYCELWCFSSCVIYIVVAVFGPAVITVIRERGDLTQQTSTRLEWVKHFHSVSSASVHTL